MGPTGTPHASSQYARNGKRTYLDYHVDKLGDYQLQFRIIETKSPHQQGIAMFFRDFKGKLLLNGKKLPVLKGPFKHYTFKENTIPNGEFTITVHAEGGYFFFQNASEHIPSDTFRCGFYGCAFWIEELEENHIRFHCNDHEYDDDFDDLIFDLVII